MASIQENKPNLDCLKTPEFTKDQHILPDQPNNK